MISSRPFRVPPTIHFGEQATARTGEEVKRLGARKALLVTDAVLAKVGAIDPIVDSLKNHGVDVVVFDEVNCEPVLRHVNEGLALLEEKQCDVLVACGGGSPIDAAKAIGIMATNQGQIKDYMGLDKFKTAGVPVIAVPTTAGTGSEATMFSIITDTDNDVKMLIGSPLLMPKVAIVDPLMTLKLPRGLTAATGLDALTHAIEAYVSLKAQPMTDVLAISAIKLISTYLPLAWGSPDNREARANTMLGALQAGIAFSNASVALVHGMSRPIGANFHIAHGVSNAVLLGIIMDFSLSGNPGRYADIARAMGVGNGGQDAMGVAKAGAEKVKGLIKMLEVPSLTALGVTREKLEPVVKKMAEDALASGSPGNNPRQATAEEIVNLYYAAL
ncbi:MAG: iron-containing alcohol dehydrogenase [Syntrophotalea acetylenica]|uniref:Alcohol dehydrogenase n=1 Tax=Syntrophotalea acetylenica TaxID=29542 RepID=A0A1L3GHE5_SYNAC|nr:iron-containing alcohol dehydrogenase [Syntrophotalea acetylenica]APG25098.1 alcohol dehydrogenase [Syntrophotalea acetylenica]APG43167.1 alcohol dehydrogenase [Syntrophotalea acetylenica]MDD4456025.1 iron-containing alcohol dehydrogenase [Syntrophotalea acetylenica]MDY0260906.1 iron-containing alcohol dehydrogenase [Syntrophotalea acetylenica]